MKRLYNLEPNEVSLVPRGANKKKFLIHKSKEGKPMPTPTQELRELVKNVDPAVMLNVEKVVKAMKSKAEKGATATGGDSQDLSDRAQAALKAVARILSPFKDEISDAHMDAVQNEVGIEAPDDKTPKDEIEMSMDMPDGVEKDHHDEAMGMAKSSYMQHMEKMGYRKYPDQQPKVGSEKGVMKDEDGDDEEEEEDSSVSKVAKSEGALDLSAFPVGQRAQLEAIFKSHADLTQENKTLVEKTANLEKELKVERDERVLKQFQEKTRGLTHLGADSEELAVVLKSLNDSNPESMAKIEAVLKAANEQVRVAAATGGLFSERGSSQGRTGGGNSAQDKLEALVDATVQKSDGNKSREQIYEDVLKTAEGKRLYTEYKGARKGGI